MLVEIYKKDDYWYIKDINGTEWNICTNTVTFPEIEIDDKKKVKQLLKLKEAGFEADDIIEMKEKGLL